MENQYLGAVLRTQAAQRLFSPLEDLRDRQAGNWCVQHQDTNLLLQARGAQWPMFAIDSLAVLVRGYAMPRDHSVRTQPGTVAEFVGRHYRNTGELPIDQLEGSFTIALLDGAAGRLLLYRNLIGTGFTYYTSSADGILFGSNLADLVDAADRPVSPNEDALPTYFLYRFVPGRETLFNGFYRLLPGELLIFEGGLLGLQQKRSLADLFEPGKSVAGDPVEAVDHTLRQVLRDQATVAPEAANLLSGGVDSSCIQGIWNQVRPTSAGANVSYSISVDHPRTHLDTQYALSASYALRTRHVLVPADESYADYLVDTIATTGEPPNHVQSAYFGHLARVMVKRGAGVGLCGEGADSLFGVDAGDVIRTASTIRRLLPLSGLRQGLGWMAGALGREYFRDCCTQADYIDDVTHPDHPINRQSVFAERSAVRACFGEPAVRDASAKCRSMLDRNQVPADQVRRVHFMGYLAEAMNSASLWTGLFNAAGGDLLCPFLDSRLLRFVLNREPSVCYPYRRPKELLKRTLCRYMPSKLVYRPKLSFGQPIFNWLAPGGQLRPWVEQIGQYPFVSPSTLATALARPGWFLYSLLCYDVWHKIYIDRSLPRRTSRAAFSSSTAPSELLARE